MTNRERAAEWIAFFMSDEDAEIEQFALADLLDQVAAEARASEREAAVRHLRKDAAVVPAAFTSDGMSIMPAAYRTAHITLEEAANDLERGDHQRRLEKDQAGPKLRREYVK